jgi:hypothetical protein
MNFKIFQIPSVYTIWDGLSLKPSHATVPLKSKEYAKTMPDDLNGPYIKKIKWGTVLA